MTNPFGDPDPIPVGARSYLILISASKDNLALIQKIHTNIQADVDKKAAPLWVDSKGIGILVNTSLVAWEIQKKALNVDIKIGLEDLRGFLITEVGPDWATHKDAKTEHWLTTHVGSPTPAPAGKGRRR
ncbi:MAG: hypothetical protein KA735_06680 [Burkholderiaceae bacterium]|nr:hypothetical protein [Burkholderiaceae bacterium]